MRRRYFRVPTIEVDDAEGDRADVATVAEPEMEVEDRQSEGEPEPDEEKLQDIPDYEEEVTQAMLDERRPLLLPGRTMVTDPHLTQAGAAMQPIYCPEMKQGKCIDAKRPAFAYMADYLVRAMYKAWPTTSSWVAMPYFQMQEKFWQGCRYDVLGNWPGKLCEVDPESKISRDVTDEEILEFARAKADPKDPEGVYLLRRFKANQILSTLTFRWDTLGRRSTRRPTTTGIS